MNTSHGTGTARWLNRVPEVTLLFWIVKIMATTVGVTAADFLNFNLHVGLTGTSVVMGALLLIALPLQIRSGRYVPSMYWITVALISVCGTLITDNLVDNFSIRLELTAVILGLALLAILAVWYASERTLSIRAIHTLKREFFYWAAIFVTFALGTAAGDLASQGLHLGYATSASTFGILVGIVAVGHYFFKLNPVVAFWSAYVLTRPFGASCGDLLSQPRVAGGLGLGTFVTNAVFLIGILGIVSYFTLRSRNASLSPSKSR